MITNSELDVALDWNRPGVRFDNQAINDTLAIKVDADPWLGFIKS